MRYFLILLVCVELVHPGMLFARQSPADAIVKRVQQRLNVDERRAVGLILMINDFADSVQHCISYLAQSEDDTTLKDQKASEIISDYFDGPGSQVEVSSLNRYPPIRRYDVERYFRNLSRLQRYQYTHVELDYTPDYLGVGDFRRTDDNRWNLLISVWQHFRGTRGDGGVYEEWTRKNFSLTFRFVDENVVIVVHEIIVAETVDPIRWNRLRSRLQLDSVRVE